ncbi:hypothetical protein E0Z10_g5734 [Xylaria hypoxylon]|uniref:non-specific serine/threonine protein kinase n=1 Tax=Xylaria hypoxylon TaxID=37992 RepID=A0A4Z0YSL4_9PEZI|nr:hypothetical protein E0Z10_g5734 [Xylaria hypoxylon]
MFRRPPGEGRLVAPQRTVFLALAVLLIPWLHFVDAQQQQQQVPRHRPSAQPPHFASIVKDGGGIGVGTLDRQGLPRLRQESPLEGQNQVVPKLATTKSKNYARSRGGGSSIIATKQQSNNVPSLNDASALATFAPAKPVRAPNFPRHMPSIFSGSGLSSPHSARSLENWEVEDYILLATVDGHLYAADRESGDERWHLQVEQPVVETIHYRPNASSAGDKHSQDRHPLDDYVWAIEPTNNGAVYVWTPSHYGAGLMSTGYTMKQLVDELGHYASSDPPVVYTGHKKNTLITVDAATGRVLKWFGQAGAQVDQSATCFPPNKRLLDTDNEECSNEGSVTLSRTEYTVDIHRRDNGRDIATLKYAEWGPNNFDNDLHRQYNSPPDNRYFTSQHDGRVYAIAHPASTTSFALEFSVPVVRVFDVARPLDAPPRSNPELVLLPQPVPPARDEDSAWARSHSVFLNQTRSGGWYAMSGRSYPLVVDGPTAQVNRRSSWENEVFLDAAHLPAALVGVHTLGDGIGMPDWSSDVPPSLPSESFSDSNFESAVGGDPVPTTVPGIENELPQIVETVKTLPRYALDSFQDLFKNPLVLCLLVYVSYRYFKQARRSSFSDYLKTQTFVQPTDPSSESQAQVAEEPSSIAPDADETETTFPASEKPVTIQATRSGTVSSDSEVLPANSAQEEQLAEQESPDKKKKAHRGRRGGVKHRKGAKKQRDAADGSPGNEPTEVDGSIPGLQNIGIPPRLEPNITTTINDPEDVSGPIINIGGIEVNQDYQLGMGSNGTVVFAGKFHGRDVAVKRMLTQFWDIATKETQLLLESDHHQNVIRYYAMSKNDSFLYIALELCQASLSDVVDRPNQFPELARAGELDLPRVLLQVANGLSFLHDLRIVHRDLKPQNILVTMGRDGRPRLLVSDFGLCKKLEGGQSSFGATTAHAAGTSGWRAPELLLDDDARETSNMSMSSIHSDSSSQLVSADVMPNRRATRAIDIFSLGLVFFYVLTKGLHPFDCGDRYMREVNIRKGQFSLKPLEVLGDVAYEAKALIETMLRADPRARPTAKDVMSHPFFWSAKEQLAFLCDVSDHFELEPRDPMSPALAALEDCAPQVCRGDFLKALPKEFVESLGKQRKYTGTKFLDLLRALRNKRSHYGDMSDSLKRTVGPIPDGYLGFWTRRFPNLLIVCCTVIYKLNLEKLDTFQEYFKPRLPL